MTIIRKATEKDIPAVEKLYDEIHTAEENKQQIGWIRGVYPVRATAEMALFKPISMEFPESSWCC